MCRLVVMMMMATTTAATTIMEKEVMIMGLLLSVSSADVCNHLWGSNALCQCVGGLIIVCVGNLFCQHAVSHPSLLTTVTRISHGCSGTHRSFLVSSEVPRKTLSRTYYKCLSSCLAFFLFIQCVIHQPLSQN